MTTERKIDGIIKGVRTQTKATNEGDVRHITVIRLEVEDLDKHVLEQLALAELGGRLLTVALIGRQ